MLFPLRKQQMQTGKIIFRNLKKITLHSITFVVDQYLGVIINCTRTWKGLIIKEIWPYISEKASIKGH